MQSRSLLLLSGLVVGLFACSPDEGHHGGGRARPEPAPCEAQTTCGACTPILGCGWCQYADGSGSCASGPEACRELSFRWNWETVDCPASLVDAGPAPTDAGPAPTDAAPAPTDAAPAADSAPPSDAGPTDAATTCAVRSGGPTTCVPTTGGSLCPAGRYTLGCHGADAPDPTWGCAKAYGSGTETYFCCPCAP